MPAIGTPRTIDVQANVGNGEIEFAMSEGGVPIPNNRIVCAKAPPSRRYNDYHPFIFRLQNGPGVDLRFAAVSTDAFWVKKKKPWLLWVSCPRSPRQHPHIEPRGVSAGDMELEVWNWNPVHSKYKFALNFVDLNNNGAPVSFDPIWDNQNGGEQ